MRPAGSIRRKISLATQPRVIAWYSRRLSSRSGNRAAWDSMTAPTWFFLMFAGKSDSGSIDWSKLARPPSWRIRSATVRSCLPFRANSGQ